MNKLNVMLVAILQVLLFFDTNTATHIVTFASFTYSPNALNVEVGDVIQWNGNFASHPLSTSSVPTGGTAITSVNTGTNFSYSVTVAGTYNHG